MKCDIITPTYNRPKLLQRAIKSVLAQTSPNWEHWIYDDGSDYDFQKIVQEFKDPRIHFVQGPKKTMEERWKTFSPSVARNILFKKSKNELIAYLDDDNYLWPKAIGIATRCFTKHPDRDVIYGRLTYSGRKTDRLAKEKRKSRMFDNGLLDIGQVIHRRKCLDFMEKRYGQCLPEGVRIGPEYSFHRHLIRKFKFHRVEFYLINHWEHPFNLQRLKRQGKNETTRRE